MISRLEVINVTLLRGDVIERMDGQHRPGGAKTRQLEIEGTTPCDLCQSVPFETWAS